MLVFTLAILLLSGCEKGIYREQGFLKNIPLSLIVVTDKKPNWDTIFAFVDNRVGIFDYRIEGSPIWRLNRDAKLTVRGTLKDVIVESLKIAKESNGAFDPTILALTKLWDFDEGGRLPSLKDIEERKKYVNYRQVSIMDADDGSSIIRFPVGFGLDLGGIAKGAIVDELADYLEKRGYKQFLIEAGGDILVKGLKIDRKWKIGIKHPRKEGELIAIIPLGERGKRISIVTSGDYEQYFIKDGKRYNHIIDPRTGFPASSAVSVTVIADSCMRADALSTAAFVIGSKGAMEFLKREDVKGLLIWEVDDRLFAEETDNFPIGLDELNLN